MFAFKQLCLRAKRFPLQNCKNRAVHMAASFVILWCRWPHVTTLAGGREVTARLVGLRSSPSFASRLCTETDVLVHLDAMCAACIGRRTIFFSRVAPESEDGTSGSTLSGAIRSGPEPEAPISPRTAGVMGMRKCVCVCVCVCVRVFF